MEFQDVVRKRRMVRNYRSEPVDRAAIERVVEAGRRGPSAGYAQGIYLIVVTEAAARAEIAGLADEDAYAARGFDRWISKAPVHVVVCVRESDYHERYRQPDKLQEDGSEISWPVPYWWFDAGAALMLLLLGAVDEGLAAGFFGVHRLEGLQEVLGIPKDVMPAGVVTIGHRAPDRRSSSIDRGRKPVERTIHWERWD